MVAADGDALLVTVRQAGPDVSARVRLRARGRPAVRRWWPSTCGSVRVPVPDVLVNWVIRNYDPSTRIAARLPFPIELGRVSVGGDALRDLGGSTMRETAVAKRGRARKILTLLQRAYPDARIALDFTTPLELLVATILSAQCTDERVNMVTPGLFQKYRDRSRLLASADPATLEQEIRSTGFYRAKTRSLIGMARGARRAPRRATCRRSRRP